MGFLKDLVGGTQSKARRRTRANVLQGMGILEGQMGGRSMFYNPALQALQGGVIGNLQKAYQEIGTLGREQKRQALEREQAAQGDIQQQMMSRGLGSSTVLAGLQRGLSADTSRRLAEIQESMSGLRASALGNLAGGYGQLANFYTGQQAHDAALAQQRASMIGGLQYQGQPGIGGQLIGAGLGAAIGSFGGPAGALKGAQAGWNATAPQPQFPGSVPGNYW